jgi:hypothetical protein
MGKAARPHGQMKSNLNKTDFKKRLKALTSSDEGLYLLTPYNSSGTPFCGTFNERTFELTRNSHWRHVKNIKIKGEYIESDKHSTEVTYDVGLSKTMKFLMKGFLIGAFILFNGFVFYNSDHFDLSIFLTINGFIIFAGLFGLAINWITKKIIDQRFRTEFEIGVEDEWERLARSTERQRL